MKKWIAAAAAAGVLAWMGPVLAGSAAVGPAAAASSKSGQRATATPKAMEIGARRRALHPARYASRPSYRPYYYDRPDYYRPYPYNAPAPFFLGIGFGPWW